MELPGRRKKGRLQRSFIDVVKQDMQRPDMTEEDAIDGVRYRQMTCCDDL